MPRPLLKTIPALCVILGACSSSPDINIPAPWEEVEGPRAEVPTPNLEPVAPGWTRLASSVRGKPILAATLGEGPYHIYVIGGIAGDEPEGPAAAEKLRGELFKHLPDGATIRVVRDMNPDGTAARTRVNTRSVDLTGNWPSRDYVVDPKHGARAASELETTAIQNDLAEFKPNLVILFRSSQRGPMVSMEGPGPLLAATFGSAARAIDPRWRALPERRHTGVGSPESYVAGTLARPVLTIEFQRGRDAATNADSVRAGIAALAARNSASGVAAALVPTPLAQHP